MSTPVRVFVAASDGEWLPMRVLEFSIRETSSRDIALRAIGSAGRPIPEPRERRNRARTPFSFQRFLIPELCGFEGRAIYLDADMQVFGEIAQVWEHPMGSHDLLAVSEGNDGRKGQFSVMLLDCARLGWRIEDIVAGLDARAYSYEELMQDMCVARSVGRTLSPAWNSLESYTPGVTQLLHYTDMDTQPWVSLDNPLGDLWVDCLRRAVAAGAVTRADLQREVALGHVRPSLLAQVEGDRDAPEWRRQDRGFTAPYKSIRSGRASAYTTWRSALSAYGRRGIQRLRSIAGR